MLEHEANGEVNDKPIPAEAPSPNTPSEEQQQIDDADVSLCPCILPTPSRATERINVPRCPSCGEPHEYIEVKPFNAANASLTHWYICPRTGDPAMLTIAAECGRTTTLRPDLLATITEAQRSNRYVFGIFWVAQRPADPEPRLYHVWFQNDFPLGDMPACTEWLRKDFAEKVGPPPQRSLPQAPAIKPMFDLLGKGGFGSN